LGGEYDGWELAVDPGGTEIGEPSQKVN